MVERYDSQCELVAQKNGGYVDYDDYAAMMAERDYLKMKVENAEKVGVTWTHIYEGEEMAGYPGAEEHGEQLNSIRAERDEWKRRCEQAESDRKQLGDRWHELRSQLDAILAIAEGRDNG